MAVDVSYTVPVGGSVYAGRVAPVVAAFLAALDTIQGNVVAAPAPAPAPPLSVGAQMATLSLRSEGAALTAAPYSATIFPARGAVPAGSIVASSSDNTLRGAILSAWDDGSAAVVVCSGQATVSSGGTDSVPINVATGSAGPSLGTGAIAALVSSVAVNFQGSYGSVSLTSFGSPERTWWATPGTICARYRLAAPTPGTTALEAVIDIQAWSDRALVEVVIENSKFNAAASTTSTKPTAGSYTGATVSVNGSTIATVSSSASPQTTHDAFRAWYAAGWVGAGNPALRATQLHTELQEHPLLFRCDQAATFSMATYASDAYAVWGIGRHRASMGATGDDDTLGAIPAWEARALQSGDYRAWKATEASALSILSYSINTRDSVTGAVPHSAVMPQKVQDSFWANWPSNTAGPAFEVAHQPAVGLMAFLSRPSPVFIELAQKVGTWTATNYGTRDLKNNMDEGALGIDDCTGIIGNQQLRSKGRGIRNLLHAAWLSPSSHPWRAGGIEWLDRNVRYLKAYTSNSKFVLGALWEGEPDAPVSLTPGLAGQNSSMWMLHVVIPEVHKLAESQILASISSARQIEADAVADAIALQPVRWINEQTNGGWRFLTYRTRQGSSGSMTTYTTWGAQRAADVTTGAPSAVTGQWGGDVIGDETSWSAIEALGFQTTAYQNTTYTADFWNALAASVERGVSAASGDAATAWQTMISGITNLAAWRAPFGSNPKASAVPRTGLAPAWMSSAPLNQYVALSGTSGAGGSAVDAYSTFIIGADLKARIAIAGGHGNSSDNRVSQCDVSVNVPGGFTVLSAASLERPFRPGDGGTLPADSAYYFDNAGGTVNPKPGSRHTYPVMMLLDEVGQRIFAIGYFATYPNASCWNLIDVFNLATNQWDAPDTWPRTGTATARTEFSGILLGNVFHDKLANLAYWKTDNYLWRLNLATGVRTQVAASFDVVGGSGYGGFDVLGRFPGFSRSRNEFFSLQYGNGIDGGSTLAAGRVRNPSSGSPLPDTITFNASAALTDLQNCRPWYVQPEFDELRGLYVVTGGGVGNTVGSLVTTDWTKVFEIVPNSGTAWDVQVATLSSTAVLPGTVPPEGLQGRHRYIQRGGVGGFLVLARASANLHFNRKT